MFEFGDFYLIYIRYVGHVFDADVKHDHAFVQNFIVQEVVQHRPWHAVGVGSEKDSGALNSMRSAIVKTGEKGVKRHGILLQATMEQNAPLTPGRQHGENSHAE